MKAAMYCSQLLLKQTRNFYCGFGRNFKNGDLKMVKQQELQLSPEDQKKKQLIELEMAVERDSGNFFIPQRVEDKYWEQLLKIKTPFERRNFYKYLKTNELYEKRQKEIHRMKVLRRSKESENRTKSYGNHIQYGLWLNTLFFRFTKSSLNKPYYIYNNLRDAVMFGQKLVFDLGYEEKMNTMEMNTTVSQINISHGSNKRNKEPFYFNFCNVNMDGLLVQKLKLALPLLQKPHPLLNVTNKSYIDLFPKDKLVYLTPHCEETLETYSHDDIYIIGGFADKSRQGPVSLGKAKRDDIRMASLPLDKYLNCRFVNKNLTIDQIVSILLTMKETMDWKKALRHVPSRKTKIHYVKF